MNKRSATKRDQVFMELAYCMAQLSKDESTHIGAVIVGPAHEIRSMGYNSFPRGINDDVPERQKRPRKYFFFAHAEANAVFNAARVGIPLEGCRLYTNGTPCDKCTQAIIGAGISEVIIDADWEREFNRLGSAEWLEAHKASRAMLKEAGIKVRTIKLSEHRLPAFLRGQILDLD